MNKLYINITNHCNESCPFCCMSSSPSKSRYLDFDKFFYLIKTITKDKQDNKYIVQLEGGEPLTHPHLILMLEWTSIQNYIEEIVIDTNGLLLDKYIDKIVDIAIRNNKKIVIKPSYNNYLKTKHPNLRNKIVDIGLAVEFIENIDYIVNIRGNNEDELKQLNEDIPSYIKRTSFLLNRYGKAKDMTWLPELQINQVYEDWKCFNSKGISFNKDLLKRAESEV